MIHAWHLGTKFIFDIQVIFFSNNMFENQIVREGSRSRTEISLYCIILYLTVSPNHTNLPNLLYSLAEIADAATARRHCRELLPPGAQAGTGRVPPVQCRGHHEVRERTG